MLFPKQIWKAFCPAICLLILVGCADSVKGSPPQSAIDYILNIHNKKASELRDLKLVDSENLPLSDADRANGITEKWCVALSYISQVDNGKWNDISLVWVVDNIDGSWQEDDIMMVNLDPFGYRNVNWLSGNCDWLR